MKAARSLPALVLSALAVAACARPDRGSDSGPAPIRIGWQTTWATQGQLAVILQKTNILDLVGLEGRFAGFSYGGPLNEAALAGEVDALFTADQPALTLCNRAARWRIVGRLMYNRVGTFVAAGSPVKSVAELKGRKLAVPFGAAAHREALAALRQAGLDPERDVNVVNVGVQELVAMVRGGARNGLWGDIAAAAVWDPALADLERSGLVQPIAHGLVTAVVVMDGRYLDGHPDADRRLLHALRLAYDVYRRDPAQANRWFEEASSLRFAPGALDLAASVEPNLKAGSFEQITVTLTERDLASIESVAAFMTAARLLPGPLQLSTAVRQPRDDAAGLPSSGDVRQR